MLHLPRTVAERFGGSVTFLAALGRHLLRRLPGERGCAPPRKLGGTVCGPARVPVPAPGVAMLRPQLLVLGKQQSLSLSLLFFSPPKIISRFGGSGKACVLDSAPEEMGVGKPLLPVCCPSYS